MPPMPICRQAPSSISPAIRRATARSISVGGGIRQFRRRLVIAFDDVIHLAYVHAVLIAVDIGQPRLTSTMTILALSTTARCQRLAALKLK